MRKIYATPDKSSTIFFVGETFPNRSDYVGRVVATNKDGIITIFNDAARFFERGTDISIPSSYTTPDNLPATLEVEVSKNSGSYFEIDTAQLLMPVGSSTSISGSVPVTQGGPFSVTVTNPGGGGEGGDVIVDFPDNYPLPTSQLNTLTPQKNNLTNDELRASPLAVGGTVALNQATLDALENVTVSLSTGNVVGLDAASLAALEAITVSGTVALDTGTLSALENINAVVSGIVGLDSSTLAALESITATVSGAVSITNLPSSYPLPNEQLEVITPQKNGLTNEQLRSFPLNVSQDSGENEYLHAVATATSTGDLNVITPSSGKRIRLKWFYAVNEPTASSAPLIKVKIGSREIYRAWAISKRQTITGGINESLVVNLSGSSGNVAITAIYEEI